MARLLSKRKNERMLKYLIKEDAGNFSEEDKKVFLERLREHVEEDVLLTPKYKNGFSLIHVDTKNYGNFSLEDTIKPNIVRLEVSSPDFCKRESLYRKETIGKYISGKIENFIDIYQAVYQS